MQSKTIMYKYTSRSRPSNFLRGLYSIINLSDDPNYFIVVSLDEDDTSMNNEQILGILRNQPNVYVFLGTSRSKIHAINRDLDKIPLPWDILVNMSDDMVFITKGFDNIIRSQFDRDDRFIHFNDGNQPRLATMTIEDRVHFERFGYIYHPDYKSLFCDNEQQDVAKILRSYKKVDDNIIIFNHIHPAFGHSYNDAQYKHTESFYSEDRNTYLKRRSDFFEIYKQFSSIEQLKTHLNLK